jgi:hypothetical protein
VGMWLFLLLGLPVYIPVVFDSFFMGVNRSCSVKDNMSPRLVSFYREVDSTKGRPRAVKVLTGVIHLPLLISMVAIIFESHIRRGTGGTIGYTSAILGS